MKIPTREDQAELKTEEIWTWEDHTSAHVPVRVFPACEESGGGGGAGGLHDNTASGGFKYFVPDWKTNWLLKSK